MRSRAPVSATLSVSVAIGCGVHMASTQARSFSLTRNTAAGTGLSVSSPFCVAAAIASRTGCEAPIREPRPVVGHEGVEEHDRGDRRLRLLGHAGHNHAAIGVADQHNAAETLPLDHVDDVGDVSCEIHVWR